jgi:hypothetical protein
MNMRDIAELDDKGFKRFAYQSGAIIIILFGLLLPWLLGINWPYWPWIVAAVLIAVGQVTPASLRPVYRVWMRFGMLMHGITTPLILGVLFYLVITPIGLFMKMINRNTLDLKMNADVSSYRIASDQRNKNDVEKPF